MSPARRPRVFDTVGHTGPSADEGAPVPTPVRQEAQTSRPERRTESRTSGRTDAEEETRSAFTWRLTADQRDDLDELLIRLRRQVRPVKLDKAGILAALVTLAVERDEVRAMVIDQIRRDVPTS